MPKNTGRNILLLAILAVILFGIFQSLNGGTQADKELQYKPFIEALENQNIEKRRPLRLAYVEYEGILEISDADKFRKTLTEGIGKKKAYGFGMMTVIPI